MEFISAHGEITALYSSRRAAATKKLGISVRRAKSVSTISWHRHCETGSIFEKEIMPLSRHVPSPALACNSILFSIE